MLVDELVERVHGAVDDDVEAGFDGRVGGDLGGREGLGHCDCGLAEGGGMVRRVCVGLCVEEEQELHGG